MVVICLGCYQRPCACPQDVIATGSDCAKCWGTGIASADLPFPDLSHNCGACGGTGKRDPQDVIATPPPGSVQSDAAALDAREAPRLPGEAVPSVPFGEPDDAEARAYLDALRMALHLLAGGDEVSPAARAVLIADIRSVVGLFGRSAELGGAREGTS